MSNFQVLIGVTVLLTNWISINAIRLHPHFPDNYGDIFNGDDDTITKETVLRAEKWSNYHGSKVDRFHGIRGVEWCQPFKRGVKRLVECEERGRFPVKNECRGFLMCLRKGDNPIPSCCPFGLYFDHIQRTCVGKTDARCLNVCQKTDAKYPDPHNPQKYFQCTNLGIPESVSCPNSRKDSFPARDTLIFDSKTEQCKTRETIDAELDKILGKNFDDAFQRTFGVPSFQVFNEDDFSQNAPVKSSTTKPTKPSPTIKVAPPSSPPILSPFVGFGPEPAKYKQLLDMAGDNDSDSDSSSVEGTDNDGPFYIRSPPTKI